MRLGLLLALGLEASPDLTTQAATLRTQADGLRATGQPAAALLAYQQAALLDPADPWAPFGRCATLAELQQRAEAFACLWSLPPAADGRSSADDLFAEQLRPEGAQTEDLGDGIGVPAFGEHLDGNDTTDVFAGLTLLADGGDELAELLGFLVLGGASAGLGFIEQAAVDADRDLFLRRIGEFLEYDRGRIVGAAQLALASAMPQARIQTGLCFHFKWAAYLATV